MSGPPELPSLRPQLAQIDRTAEVLGVSRTSDLLTEVAQVYTDNPGTPLKAVTDHFKVSPATGSRWIHTAREDGFLMSNHAVSGSGDGQRQPTRG